MSKIIQNAIRVLEDGEILVSSHVHDYVSHVTKTGKMYAVDGGREYLRRVFPSIPSNEDGNTPPIYEDLSLDIDDNSLNEILDELLWGTYGKDGKSPLKWKFIKDLELDHLEAIISDLNNDKYKISKWHDYVIRYWRLIKTLED